MIVTMIVCDGYECGRCSEQSGGVDRLTADKMRAILRGKGWRTGVRGPRAWTTGRKDYCPQCIAAAKRGEPV